MRIVLDTNVIVAAARSRRGASAVILAMVARGELELALSVALALEYEQVLKRELEKLSIGAEEVDDLVAFLCANSRRHEVPSGNWPLVQDPDDEFIARLAMASACDHLVTHNVRDLSQLAGQGISVVTPAQLLSIIRGKS